MDTLLTIIKHAFPIFITYRVLMALIKATLIEEKLNTFDKIWLSLLTVGGLVGWQVLYWIQINGSTN